MSLPRTASMPHPMDPSRPILGPAAAPARRPAAPTPLDRVCYGAGLAAPVLFLLSVVVGGARIPGYSHGADPVSVLGRTGAADGLAINGAWAVTGLLILLLGLALARDRAGPGPVAAGAVMVAGAASAAIALWFPMDAPGAARSVAEIGHEILVAVTALALAVALVAAGRAAAAPPAYRAITWIALAAMVAGGAGAALAHGLDWPLVGASERLTQAGYHSWLLATATIGLARRWRQP